MPSWIRNISRKRKLRKLSEMFREMLMTMDPKLVERFLEILLQAMSFMLFVDNEYHRNIEGFKGKYLFQSKDGDLTVQAVFKPSWLFQYEYLKIKRRKLKDPDITITFKDSKALMRLLLSPKPDILGAIVANEVVAAGNVNYILKFGFMTTQLQKMLESWTKKK
jgi:hypothetical protein